MIPLGSSGLGVGEGEAEEAGSVVDRRGRNVVIFGEIFRHPNDVRVLPLGMRQESFATVVVRASIRDFVARENIGRS